MCRGQADTEAWCCALQVETSEVCIPDFDYDTISWMLRYMYGCLELTPQHLSHARVSASHPYAVQTPTDSSFHAEAGNCEQSGQNKGSDARQ